MKNLEITPEKIDAAIKRHGEQTVQAALRAVQEMKKPVKTTPGVPQGYRGTRWDCFC